MPQILPQIVVHKLLRKCAGRAYSHVFFWGGHFPPDPHPISILVQFLLQSANIFMLSMRNWNIFISLAQVQNSGGKSRIGSLGDYCLSYPVSRNWNKQWKEKNNRKGLWNAMFTAVEWSDVIKDAKEPKKAVNSWLLDLGFCFFSRHWCAINKCTESWEDGRDNKTCPHTLCKWHDSERNPPAYKYTWAQNSMHKDTRSAVWQNQFSVHGQRHLVSFYDCKYLVSLPFLSLVFFLKAWLLHRWEGVEWTFRRRSLVK